jgi:ribosomal-protein-alanine N-acetyltransferase
MPLPTKPDIRTMSAADLNEVLVIEQASFKTPWKREHFESELSGRYSFPFVAELVGRVVGFVCLVSLFEEAQILDIAVSPDQRGRGIARLLMEHACSVAREQHAEVLSLEVRASSAAAIGLYRQAGFRQVGIRTNYYDSSEDALLLEKNLKETT